MKHEPIFSWDEETGTAYCILTDYQTRFYSGMAQCHPDDADMKSKKTGEEIAFKRAKINALRGYRDELKIKLKTLNELYYSINQSNKFNSKSYETKMLLRKIRLTTFDLATVRDMITVEQQSLNSLIQKKEEFYNKVRSNRRKGNDN